LRHQISSIHVALPACFHVLALISTAPTLSQTEIILTFSDLNKEDVKEISNTRQGLLVLMIKSKKDRQAGIGNCDAK